MKKDKIINIFLAELPLQLLTANHMVNNIEELKKRRNLLITTLDVKDNIYYDDIIKCYNINQKYFDMKNKRNIKGLIEKLKLITINYNEIYIFLPGIRNVLGNSLFKLFIKTKNNKKCYFCVLPEGNYSLYLQKQNYIDIFKMWIKVFLGKIGFCPYTSYYGDKVGISNAQILYSFMPEMITFFDGEVKKIPNFKRKENKKSIDKNSENKCIFLGQPIEQGMKINWEEKVNKTASFIKSNYNSYELYYKRHPRENENLVENIFRKYGFKIIEDKRTIEEIILNDNSYKIVCSYWCSALINLKLIFGKDIECLAYKGLDFYGLAKNEKDSLLKIYNYLGVKYIK